METKTLIIKKGLWDKMVLELKKRGGNERESGAFLLGHLDKPVITHFICLDDLDPHCLDTGIVRFRGSGFHLLWKYCLQHKLKVYADVHTHPDTWTGMSGADKQHPMIAQKGHLGLIIPSYATKKDQLLDGVGIYEYLGDKKWNTLPLTKNLFKIKNDGIFRRYLQSLMELFN